MIPLWQHLLTVLALFGSNALLFFISKRKIEGLQAALVTRDVLLGEDRESTATIMPGGTMVLTVKAHIGRIRIWSKYHAALQIKFEDA